MKIAINARFSGQNIMEGYGRFTNGLVTAMASAQPEDEFVMMYDRQPEISVIRGGNVKDMVKGPAARHPLLWKLWYDVSMPAMAGKAKADVIFSPDGFCSLHCSIPQVLAIHDLAYLHFPAGISGLYRWYYSHYTPLFIRKAKHIVTVSEFSMRDIIAHYPQAKGKISVVHNAADKGFHPLDWKERELVKEKHAGGSEYFLYAGSIHPRKNLLNLLKGFSWFKKRQRSSMKLILAGRLAWGADEFIKQMQSYKYRDEVILAGYVTDVEMQQLAGAAYALVYPSHWEGFGLPVLEAMQSGVPVITSSNSSMPEICGDAAMYCEPGDSEAWGKAMGHLYKDENYRAALITKGIDRASMFSWERSANKLWEIFDREIGRTVEPIFFLSASLSIFLA
ncbi:MAG TPA: glycosyltransferase family 1 protein [Chitinophagaceae bacterium]|nr:glycosyltransferase family 1 protein [Chitinophagaceae bacterium]